MRIAIFTAEFPPYPGGVATYTYELAAAGARAGHEVAVYDFGPDPTPGAGFEVVSCRPHAYENYKFPWAAMVAQTALARRRFDLLLAADLKDVVACSLVNTRAEMRAAVHGTDVQSKLLVKYFSRVGFRPLRRYRRIFANSAFTRELLLRAHPYLEPTVCRVAPLGVDRYWFQPPEAQDVAALRRRFGQLDGRFVAVCVGRLERRKGQNHAIRAVRALPAALRGRTSLLIVGRVVDKDYAAELAREAAEAEADVRLVGDIPQNELRALYGVSDLLVHAATPYQGRVEGFGLVVLEAAAAGTPTLATRVDALPEVVVEDETGLLVEDGDFAALSQALTRAATQGLRRELGKRCRQTALQYTWDRCAATTFG